MLKSIKSMKIATKYGAVVVPVKKTFEISGLIFCIHRPLLGAEVSDSGWKCTEYSTAGWKCTEYLTGRALMCCKTLKEAEYTIEKEIEYWTIKRVKKELKKYPVLNN